MKVTKETKKAITILVVKDNCVYLGERLNPNDNPGVLCFPGGKLETGEQPIQGALRELLQETGLAANRLKPLGVIKLFNPDFGDYMSYGYYLKLPQGQKPEQTEPLKTGPWKLYPISQVMEMPDQMLLAGTKLFLQATQQILNSTPTPEIV